MTDINTLWGGIDSIKQYFEEEITCVFSVDDNYAPYLGVAIHSLINNSSPKNNYQICILEDGLSNLYKTKFILLKRDNIKITFINVSTMYNAQDKFNCFTNTNFSKTQYSLCFIPSLFKDFKKVLYFDSDLIFMRDVAEIFNKDITNKQIGAVRSIKIMKDLQSKSLTDFISYTKNTLKLKNLKTYFNSGLILFNIEKINEYEYKKNFISTLTTFKNLLNPIQDILNIIFEDNVELIDLSWNVQNGYIIDDLYSQEQIYYNDEYKNSLSNPHIIHFNTQHKPWTEHLCHNSEIFWKIARNTFFYEDILCKLIYAKIKSH